MKWDGLTTWLTCTAVASEHLSWLLRRLHPDKKLRHCLFCLDVLLYGFKHVPSGLKIFLLPQELWKSQSWRNPCNTRRLKAKTLPKEGIMLHLGLPLRCLGPPSVISCLLSPHHHSSTTCLGILLQVLGPNFENSHVDNLL